MLFSPQPPQQNTRVKFHKPTLDLFRKSSNMGDDNDEDSRRRSGNLTSAQ